MAHPGPQEATRLSSWLQAGRPQAAPAGSSVCSGLQVLGPVCSGVGPAPAGRQQGSFRTSLWLCSLPHASLHSALGLSFPLQEPFGAISAKMKSQTFRSSISTGRPSAGPVASTQQRLGLPHPSSATQPCHQPNPLHLHGFASCSICRPKFNTSAKV